MLAEMIFIIWIVDRNTSDGCENISILACVGQSPAWIGEGEGEEDGQGKEGT
jgi:hypothetical protein